MVGGEGSDEPPKAGHLCDPVDWKRIESGDATSEEIDVITDKMAYRYVNMTTVDSKENFQENHLPYIKSIIDFGLNSNVAGIARASFFASAALASSLPAENLESTIFACGLAAVTAIMLKVRENLDLI